MRGRLIGIGMALLFGSLAGLSSCVSGSPPTSGPAELLLPDLKAEPPQEIYIRRNASSGDRELWFSTTIANIGDGPLEMVGVPDESRSQTLAIQRIKTEEGRFEEREAGYFVFHEDHDHWHVEEFAQLEIFSLDSHGTQAELVATTSFGALAFSNSQASLTTSSAKAITHLLERRMKNKSVAIL